MRRDEDVFIMAGDFKTLMIESKGRLPAYKDFIFGADMTYFVTNGTSTANKIAVVPRGSA